VTPSIDPPRALAHHERDLLLFLLSQPFPERDELYQQSASVQVCGECHCGCGTIDLVVPGRPEGWQAHEREIMAEAWNLDVANLPVQVMLHTVNGVLRELEVVWYAEGDAERRPDRITPSALRWGEWDLARWNSASHSPWSCYP
jgi:hypothetical protein